MKAKGEARPWLLFDAGCGYCRADAEIIETLGGGRIEAHALQEPAARAALRALGEARRWEPMLISSRRAYTGLQMKWRLAWAVGFRRAFKIRAALRRQEHARRSS
jgi:predicted DCC family thiol-disulfide oxidoreductase YuxK